MLDARCSVLTANKKWGFFSVHHTYHSTKLGIRLTRDIHTCCQACNSRTITICICCNNRLSRPVVKHPTSGVQDDRCTTEPPPRLQLKRKIQCYWYNVNYLFKTPQWVRSFTDFGKKTNSPEITILPCKKNFLFIFMLA